MMNLNKKIMRKGSVGTSTLVSIILVVLVIFFAFYFGNEGRRIGDDIKNFKNCSNMAGLYEEGVCVPAENIGEYKSEGYVCFKDDKCKPQEENSDADDASQTETTNQEDEEQESTASEEETEHVCCIKAIKMNE